MNTLSKKASFVMATLLALTASDALSQESRAVVITDGRVTINGRQLADDAVPQRLREFDGSVSFTFSGEEDPVLGFGDQLYRVEDDRIVEVESLASSNHPFMHGVDFPQIHVPDIDLSGLDSTLANLDAEFANFSFAFPDSFAFAMRMKDWGQEHAARMQALAAEIQQSVPPPGGRVRVFHGMPYADAVSSAERRARLDEERMHDHLEMERELDEESRRIAMEIKQVASEQLRAEMEADLRDHLEEAFELHQENRRSEMKELEARMEALQERLERREELREQIIRERLEFLLRGDHEPDNAN